MKLTLRILLFLFVIGLNLPAAEIDQLQGRWRTEKSRDGASYYQTVEIKEDVLTFIIHAEPDGEPLMMGRGNIELNTLAGVRILTLSAIEIGPNPTSLAPVEGEEGTRSLVYRLGYRTLHMVNNVDGEREEDPEVDTYKKLAKTTDGE